MGLYFIPSVIVNTMGASFQLTNLDAIIPLVIGSALGLGYVIKRNKEYKKVFNKINAQLKENAISLNEKSKEKEQAELYNEMELEYLIDKISNIKLELANIEQEFIDNGIKNKEIINADNLDLPSKYFFLMNDVYLERLKDEEIKMLEEYIKCIDFTNIEIPEDLYNFLMSKLFVLLLPNTSEKYLSWYGSGDDFIAPSDSIVLGLHFIKYLDNSDEDIILQERLLYKNANYIQDELAPSKNLKVAVLLFDEVIKNNQLGRK